MKRLLIFPLITCLICSGMALAEADTLRILQQGNDQYGGTEHQLEATHGDIRTGRYGVAVEHFAAQYPDMTITHGWLNTEGLGYDEIAAEAHARMGDFDILFLWYPDIQALAAEGLAADLSASGTIQEALQGWGDDDGIRALYGDETYLYAVPEMLRPTLVRIASPELLEALPATLDLETWTWDDLFDLGDALSLHGEETGQTYYLAASQIMNPLWLDQWLWNEYYGGKDVYDWDALRSMLTRWKALVDRGLIREPFGYDENWHEASASTLFQIEDLGFYQINDANTYLPPRYGDAIHLVGIDSFAYLVNPASPNLDAAMDFLACYSEPGAIAASWRYWENGIFVEGASLDAWPFGSPGVRPPAETTSGLFALWSQAIGSGFLRHTAMLPSAVYGVHQQYLDDELTLNACIEEIAALLDGD